MTSNAVLTSVQQRALEELATYRFLTIDLMRRVGVGSDPKNLRTALAPMLRHHWVGRTATVPTTPGLGRLPHLYWLRPSGAALVGDLRGEEPPPSTARTVTAVEELPHRIAIIETHIALRAWAASAGVSLDWFRGDYEPGSGKLQKATTLPYPAGRYTPDALAQITPADGKPRLLVIEVYRGGRRYTLDHFWKKLPQLREVCEAEAVERHHAAPRKARFVVLFSDEAMRGGAISRWPDHGAPLWARFFVKHVGELSDFNAGWWHPNGARRALLE